MSNRAARTAPKIPAASGKRTANGKARALEADGEIGLDGLLGDADATVARLATAIEPRLREAALEGAAVDDAGAADLAARLAGGDIDVVGEVRAVRCQRDRVVSEVRIPGDLRQEERGAVDVRVTLGIRRHREGDRPAGHGRSRDNLTGVRVDQVEPGGDDAIPQRRRAEGQRHGAGGDDPPRDAVGAGPHAPRGPDAPRGSLFMVGGRSTLPPREMLALRFLPVAVLRALGLPALLIRQGALALTWRNDYLWAGLLSTLVALSLIHI